MHRQTMIAFGSWAMARASSPGREIQACVQDAAPLEWPLGGSRRLTSGADLGCSGSRAHYKGKLLKLELHPAVPVAGTTRGIPLQHHCLGGGITHPGLPAGVCTHSEESQAC